MEIISNIFALILIGLFISLFIYLLYTLYAIFRGAAFIPTKGGDVKRMVELAELGPDTNVLDLGSGDGRILLAFARQGANCIGIEINPFLVLYSRLRLWLAGQKKAQVLRQDFWGYDLANTDILVVYLIPFYLEKLKSKIKKEMKPGSQVITYRFHFSDWPESKRNGDVWLNEVKHLSP